MKNKSLIIAIALSAILLTWIYFNSSKESPNVWSVLEKHQIYEVEKVKGQYTLVHFWAKWCEPCKEELPELIAFAQTIPPTIPLQVLAISLDPTMDIAQSVLPKELPSRFYVGLDPESKAAEALGSFQYPETLLVNPHGKILDKWVGAQKWEKPEVLEYFKKKLQGI